MMKIVKYTLVIIALINVNEAFASENWRMVLNLEGTWKFAIGDNQKWAATNFNDSDWEGIDVPANWEDEGFYGYNGFAWYRKSFDGTALKNKAGMYTLFLGYIDDADEVYLNGHKIGASGSFHPRYRTAYNALRNYYLPNEYINFQGRNVISVRVYDAQHAGGIVSGDVGIFTNSDDHALDINLRGMWDFTLASRNNNDHENGGDYNGTNIRTPPEKASWTKLSVPGIWEHQGFDDYDGSVWYRKQFTIPQSLQGEDLVFLLGKIDDYDQTYLNGKLIGSTNGHDKLRIYHLSADKVKAGVVNLLLIYVEDFRHGGGFYEGPIGIVKQSEFTRYMRWRNK